jgi:hypothetical protein
MTVQMRTPCTVSNSNFHIFFAQSAHHNYVTEQSCAIIPSTFFIPKILMKFDVEIPA